MYQKIWEKLKQDWLKKEEHDGLMQGLVPINNESWPLARTCLNLKLHFKPETSPPNWEFPWNELKFPKINHWLSMKDEASSRPMKSDSESSADGNKNTDKKIIN